MCNPSAFKIIVQIKTQGFNIWILHFWRICLLRKVTENPWQNCVPNITERWILLHQEWITMIFCQIIFKFWNLNNHKNRKMNRKKTSRTYQLKRHISMIFLVSSLKKTFNSILFCEVLGSNWLIFSSIFINQEDLMTNQNSSRRGSQPSVTFKGNKFTKNIILKNWRVAFQFAPFKA